MFADPIPGIIPFGTVTIFAGAAGVGKTAMLAEWIQRWRDGRTIWGHETRPPTAFGYLAADRQWQSHAEWFRRVGYPDIPHYSLANDPAVPLIELKSSNNALELFSLSLRKVMNGAPPPPGAHIFVDPVSPLFIAGSPNSSRDVAHTLLYFSRECQQLQINLTCTAHFSKQTGDPKTRYARPQDRIAGSGAFAGFSDTQIYLCDPEPPDIPHHLFGWVPRMSAPQSFPCQRNNMGLFQPVDTLAEDLTACNVYDCFTAGQVISLADLRVKVEQEHHYSRATVMRALDKLLEQGRIERVARGRYARVLVQ